MTTESNDNTTNQTFAMKEREQMPLLHQRVALLRPPLEPIPTRKERHLSFEPPVTVNNSSIFIAEYTIVGCGIGICDVEVHNGNVLAVEIVSNSRTQSSVVQKQLNFVVRLPHDCDPKTLHVSVDAFLFKVSAKKRRHRSCTASLKEN